MTDTLSLLRTRRSVPPQLMTGPGPTTDELRQLLVTAARVPDHGKLTPWRFVVVEGEARGRLGEVAADVFKSQNPGADADRLAVERGRFARAPLVVAVVSAAAPHVKIPEWEQVLSSGAVCMTLVVAANAMGFVTSWVTEWCAYDRAFLDRFGLKPHEKIAGFIHIGRGTPPEDRARPDMDAVVSRWNG
jgi:nitroreductase